MTHAHRRLFTALTTLGVIALSSLAAAQRQFQALPRVPFPTDKAFSGDCVVTDYDRDGLPDIVYAHVGGLVGVEVYRGDGRGGFTRVGGAVPRFPANAWRIVVGRFDKDPYPDLYVGFLGQDRLLINNRNGTFRDVTATHLPRSTDKSFGLDVADFDKDGDIDIVVAVNPRGKHQLLVNDGNAKFTKSAALDATSVGGWDVKFADVDGDKDLDLFVGNSNTQRQELYINNRGKYSNETRTRMPPAAWNTRMVAVGDVDGDGDLDAYFANFKQTDGLLLNNGRGVFTDVSSRRLPGSVLGTYAVRLVDFDEDGDLDAVLSHWTSFRATEPIVFLVNDGKGFFSDATQKRSPNININTVNICLGDVDLDRDLDVVYCNYGAQNGIYFNHEGQLLAAKAPAVGQTWVLEAHARPGYTKVPQTGVTILGSGALPRRATTPWGLLGISPPFFIGPRFVIRAPGGWQGLQIPIPNDARLRNVQLWWQALHFHLPIDIRLSNVWRETIR